jgi:hypothetical protein
MRSQCGGTCAAHGQGAGVNGTVRTHDWCTHGPPWALGTFHRNTNVHLGPTPTHRGPQLIIARRRHARLATGAPLRAHNHHPFQRLPFSISMRSPATQGCPPCTRAPLIPLAFKRTNVANAGAEQWESDSGCVVLKSSPAANRFRHSVTNDARLSLPGAQAHGGHHSPAGKSDQGLTFGVHDRQWP